ncbi:aminopeptidase [Pedobacter sp. HMWF019]|uniref:ABC transporter permease/M1 family aminopeptidase n=1 Tax=Pedobacter sp. HMWF019 TaxID=2056856 RepID=UPI000D3B691C|nr:M1 family aminopeptidase [Pedobacter sp. HMWF019]PTS94445.1 aminopeptidase [Pedobacter sp. HMWF019]
MTSLLKFELGTYFKKPGIYIAFILLFSAGFFIGLKLSFSPGNDIYRNSPYSIANMIGLLSLTTIFPTTILAAQMLFKEQDAGFSLILYATGITKAKYLFSRFGALFILSLTCFIVLIIGYLFGHLADNERSAYREFNIWFYVQPVLILGLPNLLLCAVWVSMVAWLVKNKLMVYLTGLFIYIIYLIVLTYSGSPMMAGSLPQSSDALDLSARIDPFGLSAFYQQTNLWTVTQKNNSLIYLTGNFLNNRLFYTVGSLLLMLIVYYRFKFHIHDGSHSKNEVALTGEETSVRLFKPLLGATRGYMYPFFALQSLVKQDLKVLIKSVPFVLIAFGLVFYLGMEFYGSIDQGIRLPEQYASTGLMANRIIYNLPGLLLLIILFYAHELYWRSATYHFDMIEKSTPVARGIFLISKWFSLMMVIVILTAIIIVTGIIFQLIYRYPIDWQVYLVLYWLIDFPLIICAALILLLQYLIDRKWTGLIATCILLVLLVTSIGKSLGIAHPLLRFAAPYAARYSEMNGWDHYFNSFSWRMLYGASLVTLLWLVVNQGINRLSKRQLFGLSLPFIVCMLTGIYIYKQAPSANAYVELDHSENYERFYRKFKGVNQPVVLGVKTKIDLYPNRRAYQVAGRYRLKNEGATPISELLINWDVNLKVKSVTYQTGGHNESLSTKTGMIKLKKPLLPGDSAVLGFLFSYSWNGFTGHQPFNAIVCNGTFIRISNYFPCFGYQTDMEISSPSERRKRHLGNASSLLKLEAPRGRNEFIDLDMIISAPTGQTVIGVGNLARLWQSKDRNYFQYLSGMPVPFRFGISAANYQVQKVYYKGIDVQVYYDSKHFENVKHLIKNAERTLDYCQANFGPYPYKTIRFAEVSAFTDGFAGTAYPATIFMTEHLLFHDNLNTDQGQDVINELAAHELSHQWWGNGQLAPDEREGSKLLTETLAMYTELMLARRYLSARAVQEKLAVHKNIYLNERGFTKESPLYKVKPEDTHLYYDKGILVMYKLTDLIGEENINKALKHLLQKHTYPNPPPVASDLLTELYKVSNTSQHAKINDLFVH